MSWFGNNKKEQEEEYEDDGEEEEESDDEEETDGFEDIRESIKGMSEKQLLRLIIARFENDAGFGEEEINFAKEE